MSALMFTHIRHGVSWEAEMTKPRVESMNIKLLAKRWAAERLDRGKYWEIILREGPGGELEERAGG